MERRGVRGDLTNTPNLHLCDHHPHIKVSFDIASVYRYHLATSTAVDCFGACVAEVCGFPVLMSDDVVPVGGSKVTTK